MSFWKLLVHVIREADVLLFILDARLPEMSINYDLDRMINRFKREKVLVFNKVDLLSRKDSDKLRKKYPHAFFVSGSKNLGLKKLKMHLLIMKKRSGKEDFKVGVVGYPNVGKSSIINALTHRARTAVSAKAGTTQGLQWVKLGELKIIDSPGVIPVMDKEGKLALLAAKNPEKIRNSHKVALEVIQMFMDKNQKALSDFYKVEVHLRYPYETFLNIGKKRGFLLKGGVIDERRTAIQIIQDWQRGKLKI